MSGWLWKPRARSRPSAAPSAIIAAAPSSSSSAGWNTSATRPARSGARSFSTAATPSRVAVWMSCPQACIFPGYGGGEGQPGFLVDRQRVHVGADGERRARPAALDRAHDAGAAEAGAVRDAEPRELGRDDAGGARFLEAQLGMGVDVAAQRNQPRLQRRGGVSDALPPDRSPGGGRTVSASSRSRPLVLVAAGGSWRRLKLASVPGLLGFDGAVPYARETRKRGGRCPGPCRVAPQCRRPWRSSHERPLRAARR